MREAYVFFPHGTASFSGGFGGFGGCDFGFLRLSSSGWSSKVFLPPLEWSPTRLRWQQKFRKNLFAIKNSGSSSTPIKNSGKSFFLIKNSGKSLDLFHPYQKFRQIFFFNQKFRKIFFSVSKFREPIRNQKFRKGATSNIKNSGHPHRPLPALRDFR